MVSDDLNATPLLIAAWAGHVSAVGVLLKKQVSKAHLHQKGAPPLTSSCGGHGPKTALDWAQRKQFPEVVRLLKRAGAHVTDFGQYDKSLSLC